MSGSRVAIHNTQGKGKARSNPKYQAILSNPAEEIIDRFKNQGEKNSAKNLKDLVQYPEIFSRLVGYTNNPDIERHISVRTFSRVKEDDILNMGVEILPDISFRSLAQTIRSSSIAEDFNFVDILLRFQSNPFLESVGERAFQSASESRARVGIHKIMSNIINEFQRQKAFLVEENIVIARLKSKVAPVEVQHMRDGVVYSTFLTGILDFLCCSSNVDIIPEIARYQAKAFDEWEFEGSRVVPRLATWQKINDFLLYVEKRASAFDQWLSENGNPLPRWQLLIVEAKSMEKRPTSEPDKSQAPNRELTPGLKSEVQELFFHDPDQWLLAHKNLESLLPFRKYDTVRQLDHMILDRYLYVVWHSSKDDGCQARYMPFNFLRDTGSQPHENEIETFRKLSGLPTLSKCHSCPLEPVVGVLQHKGQYLVVVVPHRFGSKDEEKRVYILGNTIDPFHRYRDSELLGEGEWKRLLNIGKYHGWNMENYLVYHIAWHQDIEEDSGPIACEVTRDIFKNGFSLKRDSPTCWCTHSIRLDILNTFHTSAIQNLARFPETHRNKSSTPEYSHYFGSRLEGLEQRLEVFWKEVSDHRSRSGFVYISKELAKSMGTCQHCNIKFIREADEYTDDEDGELPEGDDDEDSNEMREVEEFVFSEGLTPESSIHSLVDEIQQLNVSGSLQNEHGTDVIVDTLPQLDKQRSLKKHVYQAIAESLALRFAPKPERFQEDVMKFCVSSSEDWMFGVIDCTHEDRPCYITDTLTHNLTSDKNSTNFHDIVTLLLTWMCVPAEVILPYMKEM